MKRRSIAQWEFWPFWLFYTPVYLQLLGAGLRYGTLAHFCCANPGVPFGGLIEYSKQALSAYLPEAVVPKTAVLPLRSSANEIERAMRGAAIGFPCILKPDRGERGFFVEKISDRDDLAQYVGRLDAFAYALAAAGLEVERERILLQEYVDETTEFGVMWRHDPDTPDGIVSSIVRKDLLSVVGDGVCDLATLISAGERTALHEPMLRALHAERLTEVLPNGERLFLAEIGNHVRGATFRNASHEIDEEITLRFRALAEAIPGFYVGRFDVRCRDAQALRRGAFTVLEVNAVNSEPAHIYDPENTLRAAYRDLLEHWRSVHAIAAMNRRLGCRPPRVRDLVAALRRHSTRLAAARTSDRALRE